MPTHSLAAIAAALVLCASGAPSGGQLRKLPDAPYVPTPQPIVEAMLELARVGPADLVYDLGSGDGRIPITAAERFGVGI